ncbi:MAG TPA: YbhB/YbcL family Raf kinase inhibitor-like protein [Candidatus Paceibacterota bacterium]
MTPIESLGMKLEITAFRNGESIPSKFTCDGTDISPRIEWAGVPESAQSLVLIMEDRDVPKSIKPDGLFVHWILYGILPSEHAIPEGGRVGNPGLNSEGKAAYTGPCPPPQYEPSEHRYIFTLYALDIAPSFAVAPEKGAVVAMMQGHIVAQVEYMGRYKRR